MSSAAKSHAASEVRNIRLRNNLDAKLTDGWPRAAPMDGPEQLRMDGPEQLRPSSPEQLLHATPARNGNNPDLRFSLAAQTGRIHLACPHNEFFESQTQPPRRLDTTKKCWR